MSEQPDELKKLVAIAIDMGLSAEMRTKAVQLMGNMGTHEALLAQLDLAANDKLFREERELAL